MNKEEELQKKDEDEASDILNFLKPTLDESFKQMVLYGISYINVGELIERYNDHLTPTQIELLKQTKDE